MTKSVFAVVVLFVLSMVLVGCGGGDGNVVVPCTPVPGMDNGGCQSTQPVSAATPVVVKVVPVVKATTVAPIKLVATVVSVDVKGMTTCGTDAKCLFCVGQNGQYNKADTTCRLP